MSLSSLVIAGSTPTNFRLPRGSRADYVTSDVYDICNRLKAIDPRLSVIQLSHVDGRKAYAISDQGPDGVERLVFRVGPGCEIDELDARVITKIEWIRRIDVKDRQAQLEKELAKEKADREEDGREGLYDKIGGKWYDALYAGGFTGSAKPMSVRPLGPTARRAGRKA